MSHSDMSYHSMCKGYERQCFVPEVHHCVAAHQRIHKADHVMRTFRLLLRRHFIGDDVQSLINLQ